MHAAFIVVAIIAIALQGLVLLNALFGAGLAYRVNWKTRPDPASAGFCDLLETLTDAQSRSRNRIDVLTNGDRFYPAALEAIRGARKTVNLEAYIFQRGDIARKYVEALAERARAGVQVKLVVDYIGSLGITRHYFRDLLDAGGRVEWYHPLRWRAIPQLNNRTHRELMIVDGVVGFIGGAGIADNWWIGRPSGRKGRHPRWRDTVVRVEGPVVTNLQSAFADNWLRTAGEILTGDDYFVCREADGSGTEAMVVNSTPAAGSTRARILFQVLIASARSTIHITSPYFLPDRSAREELKAAVKRGVEVRVLAPGKKSDQKMTRTSSRRLYGALLKYGIRIHEYQPAMIHVKALLVDGLWCVVGSTNFDNRSFDLNDEVNLAVRDAAVTARLEEDFQRDLEFSREIGYEEWRRNAWLGPAGWLGWVLEKQE